jgi:hypothetical protein
MTIQRVIVEDNNGNEVISGSVRGCTIHELWGALKISRLQPLGIDLHPAGTARVRIGRPATLSEQCYPCCIG